MKVLADLKPYQHQLKNQHKFTKLGAAYAAPFYSKQKEYKMIINEYKLKNLLQLNGARLSTTNFVGQIHYFLKIDDDIGMTYQHPNLHFLIETAHKQIFGSGTSL